MRIRVAAVLATVALAGCAQHPVGPDPIELSIQSVADKPYKADALHTLREEGIVQNPSDVGKTLALLEMSCPFMRFSGATQANPEVLQARLADHWDMNLTVEQAEQFQVVQQKYCETA